MSEPSASVFVVFRRTARGEDYKVWEYKTRAEAEDFAARFNETNGGAYHVVEQSKGSPR